MNHCSRKHSSRKHGHLLSPRGSNVAGRPALWLVLVGILLLPTGCRDSSTSSPSGVSATAEDEALSGEEYLQWALGNLQRLEEFKGGEMRQQIVDRLNQWIRSQHLPDDWKPDPLVATLPEPLAELPVVRTLDVLNFSPYDGFALQEAVWLRDVSQWARGDGDDDLQIAKNLFDWTVRNVQLEGVSSGPRRNVPAIPWETLLLGRGTATERAWLFILLARQQGIDAVLLGLPSAGDGTGKQVQSWAVAVLVEGKLHVFDPALGLPIPAPGGVKIDEDGQLDIQPATFAQILGDEKLLRQLDLDQEHKYPVESSRLKGAVALVEASPAYLAARMQLVQSRLAREQRMVLSAFPSALVDELKQVPHLSDCRLWTWPYRVILRRSRPSPEARQAKIDEMLPFEVGRGAPLWRGRLLHLRGRFTEQTKGPAAGRQGATHYYQLARPANRDLATTKRELMTNAGPKGAARAKQVYAAILQAKLDASYWLGLVACQRKNYASAIDYFVTRTLEVSPDGPWTHGARYNLARAYEATGEPEKAIELYESDTGSAADHGNRLRARWLKQRQ